MSNNKTYDNHKVRYFFIWPFAALFYLITWLPFHKKKWHRELENFVDDPIDDLKHRFNIGLRHRGDKSK